MAAEQYNARDVVFQIEDYLNPGVWTSIGPKGIETFSKSREYETADTTTFGSAGQAESQNMQIGQTMQLEGKRLRDSATGAIDAGQLMVETQADRLGDASNVGFRFAHTSDTTWTVWAKANFQMGEEGGGTNEKVTWSVTVTRSGPSTTAAKV